MEKAADPDAATASVKFDARTGAVLAVVTILVLVSSLYL